jgi:hypothetical protein
MIICGHCKEPLEFRRGRGWLHQEGGSYKMYCLDCKWEGAPYPCPIICPKCGSFKVRDHHCALPIQQKEAECGATERDPGGRLAAPPDYGYLRGGEGR